MSWLSDASANRINKAYIKNFFDLSGNFKVRNEVTTTSSSSGGAITGAITGVTWTQLGSDIYGTDDDTKEYFGASVSLSSDGTILAAGAPYYDNDNPNSGFGVNDGLVRVFQYSGGSWTQMGSGLDGEHASTSLGVKVVLSSDGTRLAAGGHENDDGGDKSGHVRVYEWDGSDWNQMGSDIAGQNSKDYAGQGMGFSSDGTIVAIGSRGNDSNGSDAGNARVFEWDGSDWTQKGSDIVGESAGDQAGWGLSLNGDGTITAVGSRQHDSNGSNSGRVRVFEWDGSDWTQKGSSIDGESALDYSGLQIALNSDGNILAIGAPNNDGNGTDSGHVRVYEWDGSDWSQIGSDIDGEAGGDNSGRELSLSTDGTIVAIGAKNNDGTGSNAGHVRVYQYVEGSWNKLGDDIDGKNAVDMFGWSVALSSDGSIVAVGAALNDDGGVSDSGSVRVFDGGFGSGSSGSSELVTSTTMMDISGGTVSMINNTMDISSGVVDISGTTWINREQSGASVASAYQGGLVVESSGTSASNGVLHVETAGQTQAFSIRENGDLYSDNAIRYSSDDRRKIEEQLIANGTETIKKLSPQIYTKLNDLEQNGGTPVKTESGLIAQEVYYNAPELVHLVNIEDSKIGKIYVPREYDLSGNDIQQDPDYSALGWGDKSATLDYIGLLPYLIKSNQEQDALIKERQTSIDEQAQLIQQFQDRVTALENK